jgi:hypothetical protein
MTITQAKRWLRSWRRSNLAIIGLGQVHSIRRERSVPLAEKIAARLKARRDSIAIAESSIAG